MKPLLLLLLSVLSLSAANIITRDGTVYEGAEVSKVEPDGVRITYAAGVAKIDYEQMPDDLRLKYRFNAAKVAAYKKSLDDGERLREQKLAAERKAHEETDRRLEQDLRDAKERRLTEAATVQKAADDEKKKAEQEKIDRNVRIKTADEKAVKYAAFAAFLAIAGPVVGGMLFSGFIGCLLGVQRDMRTRGLVLGALLGPLGWILVLYEISFSMALLTMLFVFFMVVAGGVYAYRAARDISLVEDRKKQTEERTQP